MKKKLALILATCLCVGSLVACGGTKDKKVDSNDVKDAGSTVGAGGYTYEVSGVTIEIDTDFSEVSDSLPEVTPFEAPSCAFGDMDKVWTYSGYVIDTYQTKGVDYVAGVTLKDDTVSTKEGVAIGDSSDKVTKVYGKATSSDKSQMVYEKDNMKLIFLLKDGTVSQIQYSTMKF